MLIERYKYIILIFLIFYYKYIKISLINAKSEYLSNSGLNKERYIMQLKWIIFLIVVNRHKIKIN